MALGKETSIYSIPKGKAANQDYVTLDYFVVNGKSKYRQETLSYLADLVAYLMGQDDLWIFQGTREKQVRRKNRGGSCFGMGK